MMIVSIPMREDAMLYASQIPFSARESYTWWVEY